MKVKIFDEKHEKDLELEVNRFLETMGKNHVVVDIKYNVDMMVESMNDVYSFSAMIIYKEVDQRYKLPTEDELDRIIGMDYEEGGMSL